MRYWLKLVVIGLGIRLVLAPFFMHTWDIGTIYESSQQFLAGQDVYAYVSHMSALLREGTNMPFYYYGFAYLPQTLLIYAPFYSLYKLIFPRNCVMDFRAVEFTYPQLYVFLFLIKLPIILGDTLIIYLLSRRNQKAALFYTLNPYVLFISVLWGNFDPLVGLFILISYLYFEDKKELSGFFYGLSLIKMYPAVLFPLLIVKSFSSLRNLAKFLLGFLVASLPVLWYLLYSPQSFLDVMIFQGARPVNGVNIYNVVLSVQGIFFQTAVTRIASVILLAAIVSVTFVALKKRLPLLNSMIALMLTYMVFAPVTNEQFLAAVIPLGLLSARFDRKLWIFPLLFPALHATYIYFAIPLFWTSLELRILYETTHTAWVEAIGPYAGYIRYLISLCFAFLSFRNIHDHVKP
jgi:hypothetical protein